MTFQEDILLWSVLIFSGVCAFPSISLFSFNSLISLWFRAFPRRTFMFYAFQQRHKHCCAASWEICLLAFLLSVRWKDGYHSRIFLFNTKLQPAAHQGAFKTVWQQQWCKFIASHSVWERDGFNKMLIQIFVRLYDIRLSDCWDERYEWKQKKSKWNQRHVISSSSVCSSDVQKCSKVTQTMSVFSL